MTSFFVFFAKDEAKTAKIYINGELYREISLELYTEYKITDRFTVSVTEKGIRVTESDCGDKICVSTGYLTKSGQAAVCVPNGIAIILSGEGEADVVT